MPDVTYQEPPPQQERPAKYQVFCCEDCGGKLRISSTRGKVRWLKCRGCGAAYKMAGEEEITLRK
jgi:hypothetical protein